MKSKNYFKPIQTNQIVWFLIWVLVFSVSIWVLKLILDEFKIDNFWIGVFLVGLGLAFIYELVKSLRFKQNIYLDLEFVKELILYAVGYIISIELLKRFTFQTEVLNYS